MPAVKLFIFPGKSSNKSTFAKDAIQHNNIILPTLDNFCNIKNQSITPALTISVTTMIAFRPLRKTAQAIRDVHNINISHAMEALIFLPFIPYFFLTG